MVAFGVFLAHPLWPIPEMFPCLPPTVPQGTCVRSFCLAFMLAAFCTLSLGQESFMMHFTPAGFGATVVNRGDFNNDGIPDVITGNNGGSSGNAVSVYLGIGDGKIQKKQG